MAFEKLAVDDNHKKLRLALAMRGGVSLAAQHQAVLAVCVWRRIDSARHLDRISGMEVMETLSGTSNQSSDTGSAMPDDIARWREIFEKLQAGGVRSSHSGAEHSRRRQAGGVNAILYGLAQSCQSVMDETVRDTWIRNGGIWELLRERGLLVAAHVLGCALSTGANNQVGGEQHRVREEGQADDNSPLHAVRGHGIGRR